MQTKMQSNTHKRLSKIIIKVLMIFLLLSVLTIAFLGYLQPGFVLDMANRFVLC
jgi:flagellar basal body-associated protein FliL